MENKVILYDIKREDGDRFYLQAVLFLDGKLALEGQDFSKIALELFGDDEYEYYYMFDVMNTNKLKIALKTDNLLHSLVKFFNGEMINEKFRIFCKESDIEFDIHVI